MSKVRAILFFGVILLVAFSLTGMAQEGPITFLNGAATTSQTALLASFLASLDDGATANSAMSISNILGTPPVNGLPSGGDESGSLWIFLYNQSGTNYQFHTADFPEVGSGLDADGSLSSGGTYTVNLREILTALFPDREPADRDFSAMPGL